MFLTTNMECDHCGKVINGETYSTNILVVKIACQECYDTFMETVKQGEIQAAIDHDAWVKKITAMQESMSAEEYAKIPDHVIFSLH